MPRKTHKTTDPTIEIENKFKTQAQEETINESRYQSFLENHLENGFVTVWIIHSDKCIEPFLKYGEDLAKTQPYDDQRYHGSAKWRLNLPETEIQNFIECLKTNSLKMVQSRDKFIPQGEIRILKK